MAWQKILGIGRVLGGLAGWWKLTMLVVPTAVITGILAIVQGLSLSGTVIVFLALLAVLLVLFVAGWHAYQIAMGLTHGHSEKKRIGAQLNDWIDAGMRNIERERVAALLANTQDENSERFKTKTSWLFGAWEKDPSLLWAGNTYDHGPIRLSIPSVVRLCLAKKLTDERYLNFEVEAQQDDVGLQPPQDVRRDVWLQDVIWDKANARVEGDHDANFTRLGAFIELLRQRAADGSLPVWGKKDSSDIWLIIPPEYWTTHQIFFQTVMHDDPAEMTTEVTELGVQQLRLKSLMTSQFRVNELWP